MKKAQILNYETDNKTFLSILILGMNSRAIIGDFINLLNYAVKIKLSNVTLDFKDYHFRTYPNILLPFKGIMDYFVTGNFLTFEIINLKSPVLINTGFPNSFHVDKDSEQLSKDITHKIISFRKTEETNKIADFIFSYLQENFVFPPGVLQAANWGLSEVMDNVINHSLSTSSYVMLQVHSATDKLVFSVFDNGQGIYNSLRSSEKYAEQIKCDLDALKLCIQEKVTRDEKLGAGYGLWGLYNLVKENKGEFGITSGKASILYKDDALKEMGKILFVSDKSATTLVDLVINYKNKIDLEKVFVKKDFYDVRYSQLIEELEDTSTNEIVYKLSSTEGVRTRTDGINTLKKLLNLNTISSRTIVVDFSDINDKTTSSFIDEFIGKPFSELGFNDYYEKFRLKNMNDYSLILLQKSLSDRIKEKLSKLLTS